MDTPKTQKKLPALTEFDITGDNYIGETVDMTHNIVHVFKDVVMVYAVYNIGTDDEYIAAKEHAKVKADPDKYLFTPYVMFLGDF